jgi:hypothetical protein
MKGTPILATDDGVYRTLRSCSKRPLTPPPLYVLPTTTLCVASPFICYATANRLYDQPGNKLSSFISSAITYADLFGDYHTTFHGEVLDVLKPLSQHSDPPRTQPSKQATKRSMYNTTTNAILLTRAGQVELLFPLTGTSVGGVQSLAVQAGLQHPFSQGRLWITSNDPYVKL